MGVATLFVQKKTTIAASYSTVVRQLELVSREMESTKCPAARQKKKVAVTRVLNHSKKNQQILGKKNKQNGL